MDNTGINKARAHLTSIFPSTNGDFFKYDKKKTLATFRNHYAINNGSVHYHTMHSNKVKNIITLNLALPRNTIN